MTAIRHWLATLSVFALGGVTQSYVHPADAQTRKVTVTEIEQACDRALRANTIEALEDFLHRYPPSKYRADVACYALALDALGTFGSNNGDHTDNPSASHGNGGYGQ